LEHALVVSLLALLLRLLILIDRFVQQLHEVVETLDVLLDRIELSLALFRLVLLASRGLLLINALLGDTRPPNEDYFLAVLLRLICDLLVETLDRHEDDAFLTCVLETLLRFFLVTDHQLRFFSLDLLKCSLLFSNLIGVLEGFLASVFLVLIHLIDDLIHIAATGLVAIRQESVRVGQEHVPGGDLLQVCEVILVRHLNVTQKVLKLLQLLDFIIDELVLFLERLESELSLLYLSIFLVDFDSFILRRFLVFLLAGVLLAQEGTESNQIVLN